MERDGEAVKVGAGGTAASGAARKPLLQAVRDGDFKPPDGCPPHTEKDVSEWIFSNWMAARERDQAVVMALRRRYRLRQALVFVLGGAAGALTAAAYFSIGAI